MELEVSSNTHTGLPTVKVERKKLNQTGGGFYILQKEGLFFYDPLEIAKAIKDLSFLNFFAYSSSAKDILPELIEGYICKGFGIQLTNEALTEQLFSKYKKTKITDPELFNNLSIEIDELDNKVYDLIEKLVSLETQKINFEITYDKSIYFTLIFENISVYFDMYFEDEDGFDSVFFVYKNRKCIANGEGNHKTAFNELQGVIA